MSLDRTIDLRAEVLYRTTFRTKPNKPLSHSRGRKGRKRKRKRKRRKKICIRTFLNEAIFMASAFFGAAYRFPFFVVEDDEAGLVAFCFEVFIPLTFP